MPPCNTAPMYTSSTASLGHPALSRAALMARLPSWGAENDDSDPLNPPMGVLAAPTMTTSWVTLVEYLLTLEPTALYTDMMIIFCRCLWLIQVYSSSPLNQLERACPVCFCCFLSWAQSRFTVQCKVVLNIFSDVVYYFFLGMKL